MAQSGGKADRKYDRTVEDSFPASDPPACTGITGPSDTQRAGQAQSEVRPSDDRTEEEIPKGRPTSDRHAAQTAHVRENEPAPKNRS